MIGSMQVCARCNLRFHSEWTMEQAMAEAIKVFGPNPPPDAGVVVCDKCYEQVMKVAELNGWPKSWEAS